MNTLRLRFVAALAILAVSALAWRSAAGQSHPSQSERQKFLGSWKLVSTEEKLKDGTSRPYKDVGPNGQGYLMYTPDGHMCAVMTRPERPKWSDPPTDAQKLAAIDGLASYCGTFEIDEDRHVMWHFPEIAWDPGFAGTKQPRPYRFEGNKLTFTGKEPSTGDPTIDQWTIVWVKMK
jgi:hypothetical protein